jgi:hypothetical protein
MKRIAGRLAVLGITLLAFSMLTGCQGMFGAVVPTKKTMLWNGRDLKGWKLVVDDKSVDVRDIWSVRNGVVHCKGKPNGYMRTERTYRDYHLHLEWRWPNEPTNSGVLLHAGGADKVWPRTIECQLKAGSAGDFVLINGTGITVDGRNRQDPAKQYVGVPKKQESTEKAPGQWNTYEIYCKADTITCYVNGVLQNAGTKATDTAGWICLQSEGSPIEFRNIYVEPTD